MAPYQHCKFCRAILALLRLLWRHLVVLLFQVFSLEISVDSNVSFVFFKDRKNRRAQEHQDKEGWRGRHSQVSVGCMRFAKGDGLSSVKQHGCFQVCREGPTMEELKHSFQKV